MDVFEYIFWYINILGIIDKTAEYVAQHGRAFEENIIATQGSNPNFGFLKREDAYNVYYV